MRYEKYTVYIHRNKINNKVYVGITHHKNPERRWGFNGEKYQHSVKFSRAINKWGWENFDHITLCRTSKEIAILLEKALISYYKGKEMSYNIAEGGEGTESFSKETKEKLSKYTPWIKGKHHTKEALEKISRSSKERICSKETKKKIGDANRGIKNGMFGKPLKESHIKKLVEINRKEVVQLDNNGIPIRVYSSITEAELCLGVKGGHIGECCKGRRKTVGGYKWKYKDE